MNKILKKDIGARLRRIRETLKMSRQTMAAELGICRSYCGRCERGVYYPRAETLYALGTRLGVELDWLICGQGEMFRPTPAASTAGKIMEFATENPDVGELFHLMSKLPLLNYSVMQHFHRFKLEYSGLINDTLGEREGSR